MMIHDTCVHIIVYSLARFFFLCALFKDTTHVGKQKKVMNGYSCQFALVHVFF